MVFWHMGKFFQEVFYYANMRLRSKLTGATVFSLREVSKFSIGVQMYESKFVAALMANAKFSLRPSQFSADPWNYSRRKLFP